MLRWSCATGQGRSPRPNQATGPADPTAAAPLPPASATGARPTAELQRDREPRSPSRARRWVRRGERPSRMSMKASPPRAVSYACWRHRSEPHPAAAGPPAAASGPLSGHRPWRPAAPRSMVARSGTSVTDAGPVTWRSAGVAAPLTWLMPQRRHGLPACLPQHMAASGTQISFTPGSKRRPLPLYLQFQHDGRVHTVAFIMPVWCQRAHRRERLWSRPRPGLPAGGP
jgi:hypothetical protein